MNPHRTQYAVLQFAVLLLVALLLGCGTTYTQEEMVGIYRSEGSPTFALHLKADGTSLTDYGEGGRFPGKWERVGKVDISTIYNEYAFNVNPTFYTIISKDRLKPLLSEKALKMGISSPTFFRVGPQNH